MKSSEFRILGSELGETDSYIDVTVDGIGDDGSVYFAEKNGTRTWAKENRDIQNLTNRNLMIGSDKVAAHPLWQRAADVGSDRAQNATTDFGNDNLEDAQQSLFLAAYFETR